MADTGHQQTDITSPPYPSSAAHGLSPSIDKILGINTTDFGTNKYEAPPVYGGAVAGAGANINHTSAPSAPSAPTAAIAMQSTDEPPSAKPDMAIHHEVQDVLASDIGIATMLNRLKQSIASAKEFALFLKKRASLEDEHAKGMKKLCRQTQDNIHHADHRQGSFVKSYEEMLLIHERMAENGSKFATSLHQMHEDLFETATVAEKHRKSWKQTGLSAEQRLSDIEAAMRKSKTKYDSLAEDYDRVRSGESRPGGKFGFKGPKSAAQQEEDLLRKVQAADTDYMGKVQSYQSEKSTMATTTRPDAIKALQDLVMECDSGTTLQMQKFASFNEKLLLSNGLVITPLKKAGQQGSHSRSLKEVIQAVDNAKDLEDYTRSYFSKVPAKSSEPKYERHAVLSPPQSSQPTMSMNQMTQMHQQQLRPASQHQELPSSPAQPGQQAAAVQLHAPAPALQPSSMAPRTGTFDAGPHSFGNPSPTTSGHERSFSHGDMLNQSNPAGRQAYQQRNSVQAPPSSHYRYGNGGSISGHPPQLGALPFQTQQQRRSVSPPNEGDGVLSAVPQVPTHPQHQQSNSAQSMSPPSTVNMVAKSRQVFGVSLGRLYERDNLAVPMVVYQCIQAVDLYGLALEGIYRLSGSTSHIQKLKTMFDTDSDSRNLDFRNPENFFHDVNSVAGLLKQFFRDLPDPLLTADHYAAFIDAAKNDDDIVRRDSLHAVINSLPDPNYATLRALTLHLHRVTENSGVNRMNSQNLAIVFGPTLMGTAPGSNIADAGWQVRAVDTILQNTYEIFDED